MYGIRFRNDFIWRKTAENIGLGVEGREVCLGRSQSPSPVSYRHTWRTREVGTDKSALEIDKTSQMYEQLNQGTGGVWGKLSSCRRESVARFTP